MLIEGFNFECTETDDPNTLVNQPYATAILCALLVAKKFLGRSLTQQDLMAVGDAISEATDFDDEDYKSHAAAVAYNICSVAHTL